MPATVLKNKVMYRQFIDSVAFVNLKCCICLRLLYLYFPDTPINPLKPNDIYIYICRTAALTSRRYILNIYSTNIHSEYFKHAA